MPNAEQIKPSRRIGPQEAAELIGVTEVCLRRWRQQKLGPPYYRQVGRIYYMIPDIEAWQRGNRVDL